MFEIVPFDRHIRHLAAMDPFREFDELERSFFGNTRSMVSAFRTDVDDTGDACTREAELPGFAQDDIQVDVENDCLTISAEHKSEKKEENEKKNFVKRERFYGSFTRSFDVSGINVDGIEAKYENGILTLTMPKKAAEIPASRKLEIK